MWHQLCQSGGPQDVRPQLLRQLGVYGGAQGIWVDKARTSALSDDATGLTVGLLHTGQHYPDDFSESGVLYHYPETGRPAGRDRSEIEATKAAGIHGLPVFVITRPSGGSTFRDVYLGWIESWDDESKLFLVTFGDEPEQRTPMEVRDDEPFDLTETADRRTRESTARAGQQRFKFRVFKRYGSQCALCGIDVKAVLDAAHIRPKKQHGSDDPRNGLVLCATYHRAFDNGLIAIDPNNLTICCQKNGPDLAALAVTMARIDFLKAKPHKEALEWAWQHWLQQGSAGPE